LVRLRSSVLGPGSGKAELILGVEVSDIKFLGRRGTQRWVLVLRRACAW
jgi:hypothetical protein